MVILIVCVQDSDVASAGGSLWRCQLCMLQPSSRYLAIPAINVTPGVRLDANSQHILLWVCFVVGVCICQCVGWRSFSLYLNLVLQLRFYSNSSNESTMAVPFMYDIV